MGEQEEHEEIIKRHVRTGNTPEAINSLLFLVKKYAQQGDFEMAESMRDKITSVDPLALNEYVQAQKTIDTCKSNPEGSGHMLLWSELYDRLDQYDAQNIYNIMEKASFKPGEIIYQEGDIDRNLYFLESGQAKHVYTRNGKEVFIKKIRAGDIAGEDNFLNASYCTTTLIAINRVNVHFLTEYKLQEEASYEGLMDILRDFCLSRAKLKDLLKGNAQDRRQYPRVLLQGSILIKHPELQAAKCLRGTLRDVSTGGISFYVQADNKELLLMLLGRDLLLKFNLPPQMKEVEKIGRVQSIRDCGSPAEKDMYSVHMEFDMPLAEKSIIEAARHLKIVKHA